MTDADVDVESMKINILNKFKRDYNIPDFRKCRRITQDTVDLLFSIIEKTDKKNKEHFIKLCEDKNRNIIHSKNFCVGTECSITQTEKVECPVNTKEIGDFHTHTYINGFRPSYEDIVSSAANNPLMFCIGKSDENIESRVDHIGCYEIIDKEMLRLGKKTRESYKKGEFKKVLRLQNIMESRASELYRINDPDMGILKIKCGIDRVLIK